MNGSAKRRQTPKKLRIWDLRSLPIFLAPDCNGSRGMPGTEHLCRAKALALQHRIQRLSRTRGMAPRCFPAGGTFRARRLATECQLRPARGLHRWGGGALQGGFRRDRRGFRSHRAFRAA